MSPPTAFADREGERDRLERDLAEGQKVFLISPRRYGKSSLVRDVMQRSAAKRILTVEVTVAASSSYVAFLEAYARALVSAETPAGKLQRWAADCCRRSGRNCASTPRGRRRRDFRVAFPSVRTARDTARLAAEVFALPGRIAAARAPADGDRARRVSDHRVVRRRQRRARAARRGPGAAAVGYVFAGSEPSLMERMLTPRRPFYKAGPVMRLEKIDERTFATSSRRGSPRAGCAPRTASAPRSSSSAENVPYDVQRLAHETWDDVRAAGRKSAGLEDLHLTLTRLLNEQHTVFEESWQRLTLAQRAVLRAIVLESGRELLSADVRSRHRLPGASSVQSALAALVREDIVMKDGGATSSTTRSTASGWRGGPSEVFFFFFSAQSPAAPPMP